VKIVKASAADWDDIGCLLIDMHSEVGMAELDLGMMFAAMQDILDNGVCLLAIDDSGTAVGTVGLAISDWWYSKDRYLGDKWLYVRPEARASRAGVALVKAAKAVAAASGLKLHLAAFAPDLDRKRKLYKRLGFVEAAVYFVAKE
jgi:GNAT superfamily N-acetyltransferase